MATASYKLGQVLFVIPTNKTTLIPVQVDEIIVKNSMQGKTTSHIVKINKEGKTTDISTIDGEVFESLTTAQRAMTDRSNKAISQVIDRASKLAKDWYPGSVSEEKSLNSDAIKVKNLVTQSPTVVESEEVEVTLEDGTKARVKLPASLQ